MTTVQNYSFSSSEAASEEGHPALIINRAANEPWTPAFASRNKLMDADVADMVEKGDLAPITEKGFTGADMQEARDRAPSANPRPYNFRGKLTEPLHDRTPLPSDKERFLAKTFLTPQTYEKFIQMAKTMGLASNPHFYAATSLKSLMMAGGAAGALITKEGTMDVVIGSVLMLPASEQVAIVAHEEDHLKNRDPSAETIAKIHNIQGTEAIYGAGATLQQSIESRADLEGSGPFGSCTPHILAKAFGRMMGKSKLPQEVREYQRANHGKSAQDFYNQLPQADKDKIDKMTNFDHAHPSMLTRIWDLEEQDHHLPAICAARVRPHSSGKNYAIISG